MPRFENEGFNPQNRKRNVDRTVPTNENYYGKTPVDLNFNNRDRDVIRDNQLKRGINPCDETDASYGSYDAVPSQPAQRFKSETAEDFGIAPPQRRQNGSEQYGRNDNTNRRRSDLPDRHGRGGKEPGSKKGKSVKKKIAAIIVAVILGLVIICAGIAAGAVNRVNYNEKEENNYVSADSLQKSSSVKNILLLGVDARSGEEGSQTRSDTMMLVSLDKKHHCIKLTSFLRDSWVYIPSLGYSQRLNAACSSGGYQGVVDAVEYNFGIAVDGYAVVDFEMFKVLVDSIGGVEVEVTEAEAKEVTGHPKRYGNVKLDAGKYKLTGEQALAYCRIRKIDTDFVRTERQRTVMSAILSGVKKSNPAALLNAIYKSAPYVETDLTKGEIMSAASSAMLCIGGGIQQTKVPFDGTWEYATIKGNSVISMNIDENKQSLTEYIYTLSADEIEARQKEND